MCRKTFKAFITGGILGFLAGILFAPKEGEKTREEINQKLEEFKKLVKEKEVDKKVEKIFGEVSEKAKEAYFAVQMAVVEVLAEVKGGLSEVDKEKYSRIIEEALAGVKKRLNLSDEKVKKFKELFIKERKRIEEIKEKFLSKQSSKQKEASQKRVSKSIKKKVEEKTK